MTSKQPLVSIIVPCFNSNERLLRDAVQSVLSQTYSTWELLLVDDGSDAQTAQLLDEIAFTDGRIRCYHKENGGVSSARNKGVQIAKGKFTAFLDDDDLLAPYFLAEAVSISENMNMDMVIGGTQLLHSNTKERKSLSGGHITICTSDDMRKKLISIDDRIRFDGAYIGRGVWARLIRTELARKVLLDENIAIGEDILWNQHILCVLNKCACVESIWYYYVHYNLMSVTQSFSKDIHIKLKREMQALRQSIDLSDDAFYRIYCDHMMEEMRRVVRLELIGLPVRERRKVYRVIYTEEPWIVIREKRYWDLCNSRKRLVIVLYRMRIYLWVKQLIESSR